MNYRLKTFFNFNYGRQLCNREVLGWGGAKKASSHASIIQYWINIRMQVIVHSCDTVYMGPIGMPEAGNPAN